jgi:Tfp pilus assembly protein PilF
VNKQIELVLFITFSLLLSACTTIKDQHALSKEQVIIPINKQLFSDEEKILANESDIFILNTTQQNIFKALVADKIAQGFKLHKALEAVIIRSLSNFTYYGETYDAERTMENNTGNCMSLAVLTTAYAKLLGLDFSYREVNTIPVFDKKNNLILRSSHVQTVIYDKEFEGDENMMYFQKPGVVIDYFPRKNNRIGKRFDESTFISMYYRNLAANELVNDDLEKAFNFAIRAHSYDKSNIEAINLLAVIHRRAGDEISAEKIYKSGLQIDNTNLSLISNYIMLLKKQKRLDEVQVFQTKLDQLDDPTPYDWLEQAYVSEKNNQKEKAIFYYQKALKNAPYLKDAYVGLYHIYRAKGYYRKAKAVMKNALEWTYETEQRKQYKYKLYSLSKLQLSASQKKPQSQEVIEQLK